MKEIMIDARRSDVTMGRWAGLALVAGALAFVVTMSLHPTASDVLRAGNESARVLARNAAVHWLALTSLPLLVFGFLELSRRLCLRRPEVSLAFVVFSLGTVAIMCAAVASGLVATGVLRESLTADEAARPLLQALLGYTGRLNQAFARVYVYASSCAVILWSWAILRTRALSRSAGLLGLIVGAATLLAVGS